MYNRRLIIFLVLVCVGMLVAVARLVDVQLVRGNDYADEMARAMRYTKLLPTTRGRIYDRTGARPLAIDEPCYDFSVDYRVLSREPAWLRRRTRQIARDEGISTAHAGRLLDQRIAWTYDEACRVTGTPRRQVDQNIQSVIDRVERWRRRAGTRIMEESQPHAVIRGCDSDQAVELRQRLDGMIGASVQVSSRRVYPHDDVACHIIGRVGQVSAETIEDDPNAGDVLREYAGGEVLGASGVERLTEQTLRGVRGRRVYERNGGELSYAAPVPGQDVYISIDIELQRRLQEVMARTSYNGAMVVLDVPSGEILAMVSVPTYDLNTYSKEFNVLASERVDLPLLNRAIGRAYPPGSCIKPATALAGLGDGRISLSTIFNCRGYLYVPTAFRCSSKYGHGDLALVDAIERSCNVYFYHVGELVGAERLGWWLGQLGFGRPSGLGLAGETNGLVPSSAWLWRHRHRRFFPADGRFMAIGQGLLSATPLQVANLMATVARDGVYMSPRLLMEGGPEQQVRDLKTMGISPEQIAAIQEGMRRVVNGAHGTARKHLRVGVEVCGKTGTAETSPQWFDDNENGRRDASEIAASGYMAWFSGYAPYGNPRIAFTIVQEYTPTYGGQTCGPIAQQMIGILQEFGYLP